MLVEFMGWNWDIGHMPYSAWWRHVLIVLSSPSPTNLGSNRQHRKAMHDYLKPRALSAYHPIQERGVETLLHQLMNIPELYADHLERYVLLNTLNYIDPELESRYATSVIVVVVYGYEVMGENDSYLKLANEAMTGLVAATNIGSFLIDYIPALKYIPRQSSFLDDMYSRI
jgi:hypothetical protein